MSLHSPDRASELLAAGRVGEAIAMLRKACDAGDACAQFQWAMWLLVGDPLPRNLAEARRWLAMASPHHAEAAAVEIALTANGSGAAPDWSAALALLKNCRGSSATTQLDLLGQMRLDTDGQPIQPPNGVPLTDDGRIVRFPGFLRPAECAHIAQVTAPRMEPALVINPTTGRQIIHPVRTSDSAVVSPTVEDMVLRAINLRIAAATATSVDQGEALTILRYRPDQQFRLHHDALGTTRNQRTITFLIYLNEGFVGGETVFPDHGLSIKPQGGDAILFRNVQTDGRPDQRMRHAGAPVRQGTKWLATRWIRTRPFDAWTGPEAI